MGDGEGRWRRRDGGEKTERRERKRGSGEGMDVERKEGMGNEWENEAELKVSEGATNA